MNEQLVNMNQLKNAVIFEMQFAINQVVNSKTKKRFLEVEEVILKNVEENIDEKISAVIKVKKKINNQKAVQNFELLFLLQ